MFPRSVEKSVMRLYLLVIAIAVSLCAGCSGDGPATQASGTTFRIRNVAVTPTSATFGVLEPIQLSVNVSFETDLPSETVLKFFLRYCDDPDPRCRAVKVGAFGHGIEDAVSAFQSPLELQGPGNTFSTSTRGTFTHLHVWAYTGSSPGPDIEVPTGILDYRVVPIAITVR